MSNLVSASLQHLRQYLPDFCQLCGLGSATAVCTDCLRELPRPPAHGCQHCASALAAANAPCPQCTQYAFHFDQSLAPFAYRFAADMLIQRLKYQKRTGLAPWLAAHMHAHLLASGVRCENGLILPMPMHPKRLRERGFNHAVLLAQALARLLRLPMARNCLRRVRDTPPQVSLSGAARWRNVRNAFACEQRLDGRTVLLVDDVMSTGASLDAVARVLKAQGAARVINLLAARALPDGRTS